METRYFFEHIENGKWIDFDKANLTNNYEVAFSQPTKQRAKQWITPKNESNTYEGELMNAISYFFQTGLAQELRKKGIDLYNDFVICEYTTDSIKKRKLGSLVVEFSNGKKLNVVKMNGDVFGKLQEKHKLPIEKIDNVPSAFWGMTKIEIEQELNRIKV